MPHGAVTGLIPREGVEERLRAAITDGTMAPGQRLVEADLAVTFGATRGSVRLALDTLIAEGLVERVPNRGAHVRRVTLAEAVEITECRLVLEGLVARKAAERITGSDAIRVRQQADALREAVERGELLEYSARIAQLHALLRQIAQQPTAESLLRRLQAQIVRHQFRLSLRAGRPQQSLGELEDLVAAVVAGDPDRAEAAAHRHFRSVVTALQEAAR